jgi:DNA-binding protein HU-beta
MDALLASSFQQTLVLSTFQSAFIAVGTGRGYIYPHQPQNSITMNKAELIDAISTEAKITKADASRALEAFMNATTKSLRKGERVALVGFGTFSISKRSARNGRNPQTGKPIKIAARKVAKFKAGVELAAKIK